MFFTPLMLMLLTTAKEWYLVATFKSVGAPFTQLWGIHTFIKQGNSMKQAAPGPCHHERQVWRGLHCIAAPSPEALHQSTCSHYRADGLRNCCLECRQDRIPPSTAVRMCIPLVTGAMATHPGRRSRQILHGQWLDAQVHPAPLLPPIPTRLCHRPDLLRSRVPPRHCWTPPSPAKLRQKHVDQLNSLVAIIMECLQPPNPY